MSITRLSSAKLLLSSTSRKLQVLRLNSTTTKPLTPRQKWPELLDSDFIVNSQGEKQPDYVKLISTSRVYDVVDEAGTPLTNAINLSHRCGANIYLKREDLLPVFSFKLRGAYNMIAHLHSNSPQPISGVIACSAVTMPKELHFLRVN